MPKQESKPSYPSAPAKPAETIAQDIANRLAMALKDADRLLKALKAISR